MENALIRCRCSSFQTCPWILILGRNVMTKQFSLWYGESIDQESITFLDNLHESSCSNEQSFWALDILGTPQIFVTFRKFKTWLIWVVVFAFTDDVFGCNFLTFWYYFMRYMKMKFLYTPIHSRVVQNEPW